MATNCCKDCGNPFVSKGHNALYCPDCAKERKRMSDHEAWKRRSRKARAAKNNRPDILEARLSKRHAMELGISPVYYNLWKEQNPKSYRKWMDEHIAMERAGESYAD